MRSLLVAAALVAGLSPISRAAPPCTDYGRAIRWLGGIGFGSQNPESHWVRHVEIVDDVAYVAAERSQLQVIDVSDPAHPVPIGSVGQGEAVTDVRVSGDLLAAASAWDSVVLYDITDPRSPRRVGSVPLGVLWLLGFHGDRIVTGGVHVLDVSDPAHPTDLGRLEPSDDFTDFAFISDHLAYAPSRADGIVLYDFSAAFPARVGTWPGPWTHVAHEAGAPVAYVTGLSQGGDLFVASVDVTSAPSPRVLHLLKFTELNPGSLANRWPWITGLHVAGSRVVITTHRDNVLVDATNPERLEWRGSFSTPYYADDVEVRGETLFAASTARGLQCYSVAGFRAEAPLDRIVSDVPADGAYVRLQDFEVVGPLGYLVRSITIDDYEDPRSWSELEVFDVSDPADLRSLHVLRIGSEYPFSRLHVADGELYGQNNREFQTISLADPRRPAVLGRVELPWYPPILTEVVKTGSRMVASAFLRWPEGGIAEFDVSDPRAPVYVGVTPLPLRGQAIATRGDYAYVAASGTGVVIADLRTSPPSVIGWVGTGGSATDIEIRGDLAYVSLGEDTAGLGTNAIAVLDLADPTWPRVRRLVPVPSAALGLELRGDFLYVAAGRDGVIVFDLADPVVPVVRGTVGTGDTSSQLRLDGDRLFAFERSVVSLPVQCGVTLRSAEAPGLPGGGPLTVSARPGRGGADLAFRLGVSERADLQVYDVTGRRVRTLASGRRPAGEHRVVWDGRNEGGRRVAAGVYFVQLRTDHDAATGKIVVAR